MGKIVVSTIGDGLAFVTYELVRDAWYSSRRSLSG